MHYRLGMGGQAGMVWAYKRREEEDCVKRIFEADVCGQRSRERQRKRWIGVVKYNMEDLHFDLMDVENRIKWRWRTRVVDPLLVDPQLEGEREGGYSNMHLDG